MNKYLNCGYIVSYLLDCGVNKLVALKQNYVDLMTWHMLEAIYSVDNTRSLDSKMSSKLPDAMSTIFFLNKY
jgi:hypothetical protein